MSARRARPSSSLLWLPLLALIVTAVTVEPAAGQGGVDAPTTPAPTTAAPAPTAPTPSAPASPVDPTAESVPTTTEPFGNSLEGGATAYGGQGAFDPASTAVRPDLLAAEQGRLRGLQVALAEAQRRRDELDLSVALLEVEVAERESRSNASIEAAASAQQAALDAAVEAYVSGDERAQLAGTMGDPITYSRARTYLGALSAKRRSVSDAYRELAGRLDDEQRELATELSDRRRAAVLAGTDVMGAEEQIRDVLQNLDAINRGSHVVVDGLIFPVAGPVHFIDSWGFPRLTGTSKAHWHEGIDVMAPIGRELVATESGVIERVGVAGLGGTRLWLIGDSGVEYYYAHLSGYPDGIVDGLRVDAGEVIGYVGDTGGAAGGPAHLHMQIHPDGGDPVNPYPLLRAALETDPVPIQSDALAGPVRVLAASAGSAPAPPRRPLVPWLVSPTTEARSRLVTWTSMPR